MTQTAELRNRTPTAATANYCGEQVRREGFASLRPRGLANKWYRAGRPAGDAPVPSGRGAVLHEMLIRVVDVVGSLVLLTLSLPLFVVIVVLVRISSPGPAIYRQRRVTKGGRLFLLYKFRTMVGNAEEQTGPVLARPDDPRVTPIGRFLRRTRLDELPQLLNVLRGDMSLVGPRPERPYFVRRHRELQGARLSVKPGLTGLAQINGRYDLKPRHKVRYDHLYLRKRSVWLNLYILLKTVPVILWRRNGW